MAINKCTELSTESIPGCILQIYVWLLSPDEAGVYALASIGISALTTGFASAMISFDMDVDTPHRIGQPQFYGYIPDDNGVRMKCFALMTMISTLHNLSRSLGCALLAASNGGFVLVMYFSGCEVLLFLAWKILRGDIYYWPRLQRYAAEVSSLLERILLKVIVDYTGCLHLRHPYEMGGLMFSVSMLWAQVFPFVALKLVDESESSPFAGRMRDAIYLFLSGSCVLWIVLNITFFCTIDLSYLKTFFGTKTAPQYTVQLFEDIDADFTKFDTVFNTRIQYTEKVHKEVKVWIAENIHLWRRDEPEWFKVELIPDEFLPKGVFEEEGGANRVRRSKLSHRFSGKSSILSQTVLNNSRGSSRVSGFVVPTPAISNESQLRPMEEARASLKTDRADITRLVKEMQEQWRKFAEEIYQVRSNNFKSNFIHLKRIFEENEELVGELMERCPRIREILSHILEDKFGWRVHKVDWTSEMADWGLEECRRVGCSLATFLRKRKTGEVAVDAWRLHYPQMDVLFKEVVGFKEFMLVIANNTLRDSIYGTVYRVSVGAALSTSDAVTDIYTISTYYDSAVLIGQANALLTMILITLCLQLLNVYAQYRKKGRSVLAKEGFLTVLGLRPAVDAYRVSTNHEDEELNVDHLHEMVFNKCIELSTESIPGCVLQLYVWLLAPEKAGTYALVSIGISCLTTGYTSAMIAFDFDVDVPHRKGQPKFYGYVPDDNALRGRCFILMMLMSALHNLSRSLGCALLAVSDTEYLVFTVVGCEIGAFLLFKIVRGDFYMYVPMSATLSVIASFFSRIVSKVIVDFSGCIHFRHPYELGGLGFTLSVIWAQAFPFFALQYFPDGESKDGIVIVIAASFTLWILSNIIFFCSIDLNYLGTFVGTKTAPQYTCDLFYASREDCWRFDNMFTTRAEYKENIRRELKDWVAANIHQWKRERPDWFNIELIPDDLLPNDVFEAEGGARRRRSTVGLREIVGLRDENESSRVHPSPHVEEEMKAEDL